MTIVPVDVCLEKTIIPVEVCLEIESILMMLMWGISEVGLELIS